MRHADAALNDDHLLEIMQSASSKLCKKSKTRGRTGTPAEIIPRLLLLKHIRDWSYEEVERKVRANLVYREFTRIGGGKVPHNKSISRFGRQLVPEVMEQLHQRIIAIARENHMVQGRKLRVDTTVVESNIHYATDSTLLNDGVWFLIRLMKKVTEIAGKAGTRLLDRTRSVKRKLLDIVRASRDRSEKGQQKLKHAHGRLLASVTRVVGHAKKFSAEIARHIKRGNRTVLGEARRQLDEMIPRVQQVIRQTRQHMMAATRGPKAKSSACLNQTQRQFVKAKRASPPRSASWSRFRKPKTRSSPITRFLTRRRVTPNC
jgi:IS5 family transposase